MCSVQSPNDLDSDAPFETRTLDWCDAAQRDLVRTFDATLVLAADVVYDPAVAHALAATIYAALLGSGSHARLPTPGAWDARLPTALVACTVRSPETFAAFLDALAREPSVAPDGRAGYTLRVRDEPLTQATWPGSGLCVFPSAHDAALDGMVRMLMIQLQHGQGA